MSPAPQHLPAAPLHRPFRIMDIAPTPSGLPSAVWNARIFFVVSDDVRAGAKAEAARAVNEALEAGWEGLEIAERFPLEEIAGAHEAVEHPTKAGRVVVTI